MQGIDVGSTADVPLPEEEISSGIEESGLNMILFWEENQDQKERKRKLDNRGRLIGYLLVKEVSRPISMVSTRDEFLKCTYLHR